MTTTEAPLGDLLDLAKALGLAGPDGSIDGDWMTRPGDFLASMLSDDGQRAALLAFVTHVLDSGPLAKDGLGRTFAPVAEVAGGGRPTITIGVVLDERASEFVGLGVGLRVEVAEPRLTVDASIPLFRSGRGENLVPDNLFMGQPGADITLRAELRLAGGPPPPGEAHVGGVSVAAIIPTDLSAPSLSLSLHDLQLPGGAAPRDITVDPTEPAALAAALRDLVFGLAQTGADQLAGAAGALAGLLGLRSTDPLPGLPLDRLASDGPAALAGWLDGVLADAGSAGIWLGYLADALGAARAGDTVSVDLGDVTAVVKVSRQPSPTGVGRITLSTGATLQAGPGGDPDQVVVQASADLCTIDLQAPSVTLLPQAAIFARVGPAVGPAALVGPVGNPAVTVGSLRVGLGIGADHLPVFVLAADRVQIGSDTYPSVDLTNPGAIAQIAANAGAALLDDLLGALGPLGAVLHDLLGVGAAVAPLDVVAFVADPLGALAGRWKALLADGAAVSAALTLLRDLLADATGAGLPVAGDGSPPATGAGPWRIVLVGTVELQAWRSGPDRLVVALAARARMDTLGQRCTLVKTTVVVELVELDLARPSASFLPSVSATLALSARARTRRSYRSDRSRS